MRTSFGIALFPLALAGIVFCFFAPAVSAQEEIKSAVCALDGPPAIEGSMSHEATVSFIDDPLGKEGKCLQIAYKKNPEGWPALILNPARSFKTSDWTQFSVLEIEAFNPGAAAQTLHFTFRGGGVSGSIRTEPRKWQKLRVDLAPFHADPQVNVAAPQELHIFLDRPQEDVTLLLRRLSLIREGLKWHMERLEPLVNAWTQVGKFPTRFEDCLKSAQALVAKKEDLFKRIGENKISAEEENKLIVEAGNAYRTLLKVESEKELWLKRIEARARVMASMAKETANPEYAVGIETSLRKVFIQDDVPFEGDYERRISLSLARNECESAQIVVFAEKKDLARVRLESSELKGDAGSISAANIRISPVGYVKLRTHNKPSGWTRTVDWWPDPILTFLKEVDVKKGDSQPFWVRVHAPKDTKPGKYRGTVTVRPENSHPVKIDLAVEVWDFELPDKPSLPTAIHVHWLYPKAVHELHRKLSVSQDSGIPDEMESLSETLRRNYLDLLFEYKVFPGQIYTVKPPTTAFLKECDRKGRLEFFNIVYVGLNKSPQYYLDLLDKEIPGLKKEGLYSHAYLYGFDEAAAGDFSKLVPYLQPIKKAYPDLKIMMTSNHPDGPFRPESPIKDLVDIWVPILPCYNLQKAEEYRKLGKQVWWYICCTPDQPNWFIDRPLFEARAIMGAAAYKNRVDGFLYYSASLWPENKEPITSGPYTTWDPHNPWRPGDGCLLDAGPDGPLPTIRLENYRDGLEDYEYYKILEKLVAKLESEKKVPDERLKAARQALSVSWNPFGDPAVLYAERGKLAQMIIDLNR